MTMKKTTWKGLSAFLLACALLPAPYAGAAETVKAGDVFVTATRVEKELEQVPMSVSVITAEQIEKSSARTVAELLRDVPGVQIESSAPGLTRVQVRGENAFRSLVLVDGQKISEHKSMDGAAFLVDPSTIERIEVIKGPASVLYGSDALGGVINIITKKGGTKPIQGEAFIGFNGAARGFSEGASLSGNIDGLKYRVSGSHANYGNLHTPDGEMEDTNSRYTNGSAFVSYDFTDKFTVGGGIDYFKAAMDTYSKFMYETKKGPTPASMRVHVDEWSRTKYYVFTEAKDITDFLTRVRIDAYYQKNEKEMSNVLGIDGMPYDFMRNFANNIIRTRGLSLQTDWQLGSNSYLVAGYELTQDSLNADGRTEMMIYQYSPSYKLYEGNQLNQALYASMETQLPHDFALTYGVRWTHVQTELEKVSGDNNARTGDDSDSHPVFNVGLVWSGIEDLALRASWAQGYRAPNLSEKYLGSSMGGDDKLYLGNPDLDPEKSNNFELGARWNRGNTILDAAAFLSMATDYIAMMPVEGTTNIEMYQNVSEATTFGAELALSHAFDTEWGKFTPYVTATFIRREFDYGDGLKTYDSGTPSLFGRYGVRYAKALHPQCDFHLDVYGHSQSETKLLDNSGERYETGGFTTANIAATFDFGQKKEFSLTTEVLNLFDKRYEYLNGAMLEPGIHANVKLTYKF